MYLGKTWDCGISNRGIYSWQAADLITVLLLDEADVFLEERTMADLQRNSLVSSEH